MKTIGSLVRTLIELRKKRNIKATLLAVCPNSEAVLEAAVLSASHSHCPMLFAATLNQVDRDGGYTGWTQAGFVKKLDIFSRKYAWSGELYPCLDHGGPWLKDQHMLNNLRLAETMNEVKLSLTASLQAGYRLLHIDPTVDRTIPSGVVPVDVVISRTIELILHAEQVRKQMGLGPVDYEVGTEEVHGGLVDFHHFERFLTGLRDELEKRDMLYAWPCFIVAKVGTDLHTSFFDPEVAERLNKTVEPLGSLIKGHYTDWVENPEKYPESGMGGANVGPEFTAEEFNALYDLERKEMAICRHRTGMKPSYLLKAIENAVVASGRWKKWLLDDEVGKDFGELSPDRRRWLLQTAARYIWTDAGVVAAREILYQNLSYVMPDPHQYVVERIAGAVDRYITAFNLFDSRTLFELSNEC